MITPSDMSLFAEIIDDCKRLIQDADTQIEKNLQYILNQLYGKTLLTMCEIYTLLNNGYPEGGMALARITYETLVVMTYLCKKSEDLDMLERFYDDYQIKTCHDHINYLKWNIKIGNDSQTVQELLELRQAEFDELLEKYKDFTSTKYGKNHFEHYWWIGKPTSFSKLSEMAGYQDNFFYNIACYRVHAGITGAIIRFDDDNEDDIFIGSTQNGKEMPLYFSLLNLITQTRLFCGFHHIDCEDVIEKFEELNERLSEIFCETNF